MGVGIGETKMGAEDGNLLLLLLLLLRWGQRMVGQILAAQVGAEDVVVVEVIVVVVVHRSRGQRMVIGESLPELS